MTKTSQHYEGVIVSTNNEGDTIGVTLKDVKDISSPGQPLKEHLFIAATNIDKWNSGPADAKAPNGDCESLKLPVIVCTKLISCFKPSRLILTSARTIP